MSMIDLKVFDWDGGEKSLQFRCQRLYNAAFAGRDEALVRHHIEEISALGIAPPLSFPLVENLSPHLLSTSDELGIYAPSLAEDTTNGEIEYVLIWHQGEVLISVGSDHCDLWLEQHDLQRSKNVAPNFISAHVWRYLDVKDHFDVLVLECDVRIDGAWQLAQSAACGTLLEPDFWIRIVESQLDDPEGTVLFSGTIASIDGIKKGDAYRIRLTDPVLLRLISHEYACHSMLHLTLSGASH